MNLYNDLREFFLYQKENPQRMKRINRTLSNIAKAMGDTVTEEELNKIVW